MKLVILMAAIAMTAATTAQASCKGGKSVLNCRQISMIVGGKAFSARINNSSRFVTEQVILKDASGKEVLDMAQCPGDLLKLGNGQALTCKSEGYSYEFIDPVRDVISRDPYVLGVHELVKRSNASVNEQSDVGLLVESLESGEKIVLGCRGIIECPSPK